MPASAAKPRLAEGVWIGPFDVDLPQPAYLVRLPDARFFRISESLYQLLSCIDGMRSEERIARAVSRLWRRHVTRWEVEWALENRLGPRGLLAGRRAQDDDAEPDMEPVPPRFVEKTAGAWRVTVKAGQLGVATPLLGVLFARPVAAAVLVAVLAMLVRMVVFDGLPQVARALHQLSWLDVLVLSLLAPLLVFLHELGHLAACRRFSGTHGDVTGLLPASWSADVTEAWRLPRARRCIVDAGGVYLQLVAAVVSYAIYVGTAWPAALAAALFLQFTAAWCLLVGTRTDGWWLLTDALGLVRLDDADAWEDLLDRIDSLVAPETMNRATQGWSAWGRLWWAVLWVAGEAVAQLALIGLVVCLAMQYPEALREWWSAVAAPGGGQVWVALGGLPSLLALPAALAWTWVFESSFVRSWRRYAPQMRLWLAIALWAAARRLQPKMAAG